MSISITMCMPELVKDYIEMLKNENRRLVGRVTELEKNNYNILAADRLPIIVDVDAKNANDGFSDCLDDEDTIHKPETKQKTRPRDCRAQCGLTNEDVTALLKELCDVDNKLKLFRKIMYSVASDSGVTIGKKSEYKTVRGYARVTMPDILERACSEHPDTFHKCEIVGVGSIRQHSLKRS